MEELTKRCTSGSAITDGLKIGQDSFLEKGLWNKERLTVQQFLGDQENG
jgi:hypothetical protein